MSEVVCLAPPDSVGYTAQAWGSGLEEEEEEHDYPDWCRASGIR